MEEAHNKCQVTREWQMRGAQARKRDVRLGGELERGVHANGEVEA
jgi:hypothetical protein